MTQPQLLPGETVYADELRFLAGWDTGARPLGWQLTPRAVVTFIVGSDDARISAKFVGDRALIERCVVTLAGERGLLLVGEPGTAKSMLSELLAAAISGTSALTVQGTAGTSEEQLRYGWNYALLIARGPHPEALVPSPILVAMRAGLIARIEEVTRCLPEVQDALISILSERRLSIPELGGVDGMAYAQAGFNLIATANLRDRGVSEMSRSNAASTSSWSSRSAISSSNDGSSNARLPLRLHALAASSRSTRRCSRRWLPRFVICAPAARRRAGPSNGPAR